MLRSLRHQPPGRAARGDRKETFDAALEQSEQFMKSASRAGVATRPVLLFYALSQAGWAVNAASTTRSNGDWRLGGGHGIRARNLSTMTDPLAAVTVQDSGSGSFTAVAQTLAAASLPDETPLGDLWCLLPDAERFPLPGQGLTRLIAVGRQDSTIMRGSRTMAILANLPSHLSQAKPDGETPPDWTAERTQLEAYLAQYPSLSDAAFMSQPGQPVGLQWHDADSLSVRVRLGEATTYQEESRDIASRTHEWCGISLAYPAVGGSALSAHPLLLWWSVLFALSQLARYEPKAWARRTAIASSSDASAIENLLGRALVTLPELIHRTIMEAARDTA